MMNDIWEKFHEGNYISDEELDHMIELSEKGLEYLNARGKRFYLAAYVTRLDLVKLKGYKRAREDQRVTLPEIKRQ